MLEHKYHLIISLHVVDEDSEVKIEEGICLSYNTGSFVDQKLGLHSSCRLYPKVTSSTDDKEQSLGHKEQEKGSGFLSLVTMLKCVLRI